PDRLSVAFLISDHREPEPTWVQIATGRYAGSEYWVYRNPTAMPRAYVAPRAEPARDSARVVRRFRNADPHESVLMPADPLDPRGPRQAFTPAEWCVNEADRLVLRVETRAPGLLVVADTWMPGWTATVDGQKAPVLRGNHAQRVIPIERAGQHEIELRYKAPGFQAGLIGTSASLLIWAALMATVALRRRPSAHAQSDHARRAHALGATSVH